MNCKVSMTAIILAGGKSFRMGTDKSLLPFGEKTVLEHIVELTSPFFDEVFVVVETKTKVENLQLKGAQIREDLIKNKGPLGGIYTGLSYSNTRANCVFTCDMPFVDPILIEDLMEFWEEPYDAICLEDSNGKLHPFPGVYDRSCRSLIHLLLDQGYYSMSHFLAVVTLKPLPLQEKRMIRALTNMNAIEDYYHALSAKDRGV